MGVEAERCGLKGSRIARPVPELLQGKSPRLDSFPGVLNPTNIAPAELVVAHLGIDRATFEAIPVSQVVVMSEWG
jgi:hypothetical protein